MKKGGPKNVAASVRQRLYQLAVKKNEEFGLILTRYALERFLYRLGQSSYRDRFLLKGAMLFQAWTASPHRPTRDLDLLGYGEPTPERCRNIVREIGALRVADDGLIFDGETVRANLIKEDQEYEGVRVTLLGRLAQARIPLQIDIGFGDVVSPAPRDLDYPTLLPLAAPRIRAYSMESVIAEKLEAMVSLGLLNSRMKDFYDVWFLASGFPFERKSLAEAIRKTFERRQTAWSEHSFAALLAELAADPAKQLQWRALLKKGRAMAPEEFSSITEAIRLFMLMPLGPNTAEALRAARWAPGGPWQVAP